MDNPGSGHSSLESLQKTLHSLKEIRSALLPFLYSLKVDVDKHGRRHSHAIHTSPAFSLPSNGKRGKSVNSQGSIIKNQSTSEMNAHRRAEAQAAVALAVCTLRYMGGRLRGLDVGRTKDDPLRMELDKIRGVLMSLKNLESSDTVLAINSDDADNCLQRGTGSKLMDGDEGGQLQSNGNESRIVTDKRKSEKEASSEDVVGEGSPSNKKQRR